MTTVPRTQQLYSSGDDNGGTKITCISSFDLSASFARGISCFEHAGTAYAAVCCYSTGLVFIDVANPQSPTLKARTWDNGYFHGGAVKIGNRLFVPARQSGLYVYSLDQLTAGIVKTPFILPVPTAEETVGTEPKTTGICYDDQEDILYTFERTGGWRAITNVSRTATENLTYHPTLRRLVTDKTVLNMEVHRGEILRQNGKTYLLLPSFTTTTLLCEDVTDKTVPALQVALPSTWTNNNCWDIKVVRDNIVATSQWAYPVVFRQRSGVALYDFSVPQSPRLMSRWYDENFPYLGTGRDSPPYDIFVQDNYIYVSGGQTGLRVLDATNPYELEEVIKTPVPDQVTENFGYNAVFVKGVNIYAAAADILNPAANVRMDIFTADFSVPFKTLRDFYPVSETSKPYIDEYFTETILPQSIDDGTKNWASTITDDKHQPMTMSWGEGKTCIDLPIGAVNNKQGVRAPLPVGQREFWFTGKMKVSPLLQSNEYLYVQLLENLKGTTREDILQMVLCNAAPSMKARVKYHNGTSFVPANVYNFVIAADTYFDFRIGYKLTSNGFVSLSISGGAPLTVTGDFSAVPDPRWACLHVRGGSANEKLYATFKDRYVVDIAEEERNLMPGSLWKMEMGVLPGTLYYNASPATHKGSLEELSQNGDYCHTSGILHVYSELCPNLMPQGFYIK